MGLESAEHRGSLHMQHTSVQFLTALYIGVLVLVTIYWCSAPKCLLLLCQAMIDFEEDVPLSDAQRLQHQVQDIAKGVQQALDTARVRVQGLYIS